jgi:hypothetical protein
MVFNPVRMRVAAWATSAALVAAWMFVLERPVEAYVDPGAGSMLTQLVVGGILGGLVLLRAGWRRICGWFVRRPSRAEDTD